MTVEYGVAIDADSEEELNRLQAQGAADANREFERHFAPLLGGDFGRGAVRIEAAGGGTGAVRIEVAGRGEYDAES